MKVEIRDAQPTPPREVVITMSIEDAKDIHNRLYALLANEEYNSAKNETIRKLIDGLTTARVQI